MGGGGVEVVVRPIVMASRGAVGCMAWVSGRLREWVMSGGRCTIGGEWDQSLPVGRRAIRLPTMTLSSVVDRWWEGIVGGDGSVVVVDHTRAFQECVGGVMRGGVSVLL